MTTREKSDDDLSKNEAPVNSWAFFLRGRSSVTDPSNYCLRFCRSGSTRSRSIRCSLFCRGTCRRAVRAVFRRAVRAATLLILRI